MKNKKSEHEENSKKVSLPFPSPNSSCSVLYQPYEIRVNEDYSKAVIQNNPRAKNVYPFNIRNNQ